MTGRAILASLLIVCATAHAGDELAFDQHGFSLTLADGWVIHDVSRFYEKYISANKKAFGENTAKVLSENSQVIFKANKGELDDDAAVFTCLFARNIDGLEEMTGAQKTALLEGATRNSYLALALRGLDVTKPTLEQENGVEYSKYRMSQKGGQHITEYKAFLSSGGMVVCAGGVLSKHLDDVVFMNDSIRGLNSDT